VGSGTSSKVERTELSLLKPGQTADFFALLSEKTKRSTKDGKPYYAMKFRDRLRVVSAPVWENAPYFHQCEGWSVGQIFKIRGAYQEHKQFGPQVEIANIRLATVDDQEDGYDPDRFVARTRFDVDSLWEELIEHAMSVSNAGLRDVIVHLLRSNEEIIRLQPAASRNHHAYRGGYLEHTVSVVRTGIYLADKYLEYYPDLSPPLNRDLIVAGCILHDIGKVKELALGADLADYTVEGMLIGHIVMGRDMVREAARELGHVDPEILLYLEHIILSHQGTPEWGSPKVPMIPEAFLVHHADDIDAKMNMFIDSISKHEGDDPFTARSPALARRILAKRDS
jgi:3'-5' exoribonuclease